MYDNMQRSEGQKKELEHDRLLYNIIAQGPYIRSNWASCPIFVYHLHVQSVCTPFTTQLRTVFST